MSWLEKIIPNKAENNKRDFPEGLWIKCSSCEASLYQKDLENNLQVCHKCGHHFRVDGKTRLDYVFDNAEYKELGASISSKDVLKFKDSKRYKDRIDAAMKKTGRKNALPTGHGKINGIDVVVSAFDFSFMGGSMGAALGERFVQAIDHCIHHKLPFVCFTSSGGARMQEALVSLMQMAKTSAALKKLAENKLPYISVLTDPTTGGVSASLAMLGDIIIAEPDALIGFAGPRVIEQTVKHSLPEGFQRSEFLLEHGAVDMVVPRGQLRDTITRIFKALLKQEAA